MRWYSSRRIVTRSSRSTAQGLCRDSHTTLWRSQRRRASPRDPRSLQLEEPMRARRISAPACVRATKGDKPLFLVKLENIHDILHVPRDGVSQLLAERKAKVLEVHEPVLVHAIPASLCALATKNLRDAGQRTMILVIDAPDRRVVAESRLLDLNFAPSPWST